RRPEHRPDESGGLLPQLPVELDERGSRRQGRSRQQGREPRGRLRHALRDLEVEIPGHGEPRATGGDEEVPKRALMLPTAVKTSMPSTRPGMTICVGVLWMIVMFP